MVLNRKSISPVFLFAMLLLVSKRIDAQRQQIDTSGYIPSFYSGSLDYNLMIAAAIGYEDGITRLILKGADVTAETNEGATPLVLAVANNRLDAVKTLLSYGSDVNIITNNLESPLLIAVRNQNVEIAETLIRAGAEIDFSDRYGATPLHYAAIYGYFYITDLLLYYGADIDRKSTDGTTPLMAAIWAGNADIADILIQNGANMVARDEMGFTPLHIASQNGDTLIMNLLIKRGVDIYEKNIYNWDALTLAIKSDQVQAIELLLKKGDKWRSSEREVTDPYIVASKYGRKDVIKILERENIPGKIKREIDQIGISVSTKFTLKDIYTGFSLTFKEPFLKVGLVSGIDSKLWYTRVLLKQDENTYYQYLDKSSVIYGGLFKEFDLTDFQFRGNFAFTATLTAAYTFGNKLKGTEIVPENRYMLIPSAGFKWAKGNFSVSWSGEYQKSQFYKIGPVWLRVGCAYNILYDKVRAPGKTIKWWDK